VCNTRAATGKSPTAVEHQKPLGTTSHGKRDGVWPSRAAQGVKNTLVREVHKPITDELSGRIKQRLNQRTEASKAGGACRLEGGGEAQIWPQRLIKKTEAQPSLSTKDTSG
jgi:hypothetical protein